MNEKNALNNYKINGFSLFTRKYVFVDTTKLLYQRIFSDMGIAVLKSEEFRKEGSDLSLIIIKILKRDVEKFEQALTEVRKKALLLGYREYDQACERLYRLGLGERNEW